MAGTGVAAIGLGASPLGANGFALVDATTFARAVSGALAFTGVLMPDALVAGAWELVVERDVFEVDVLVTGALIKGVFERTVFGADVLGADVLGADVLGAEILEVVLAPPVFAADVLRGAAAVVFAAAFNGAEALTDAGAFTATLFLAALLSLTACVVDAFVFIFFSLAVGLAWTAALFTEGFAEPGRLLVLERDAGAIDETALFVPAWGFGFVAASGTDLAVLAFLVVGFLVAAAFVGVRARSTAFAPWVLRGAIFVLGGIGGTLHICPAYKGGWWQVSRDGKHIGAVQNTPPDVERRMVMRRVRWIRPEYKPPSHRQQSGPTRGEVWKTSRICELLTNA